MKFRPVLLALIAATSLVLATACTTVHVSAPAADADDQMGMMVSSADPSDVMFVQMMIPHHEQAIEIAELAPTHGASAPVLDFAGRIAAAQGPEIDQMAAMLEDWGIPQMMQDRAGHGMAMNGMVSDEDLDALRAANGAEFDRLFLESMIAHHEGAIAMTEDPLRNGEDPELRTLLESIVTAQTREIEEMRAMLESMN
jgi:uncharacterized protein (DUF305 family)